MDAVICVGNSLAIAAGPDQMRDAVAAMIAASRPGGVLIVQVLNIGRYPPDQTVWEKCRRVRRGADDHVLLKGIRRGATHAMVEVVNLTLTAEDVSPTYRTARLLNLTARDLESAAREAGAVRTEIFGDYERRPFDAATSQDILMTAYRG